MAEILNFTGETTGKVSVENVLSGAAELETVLVIGWTKDGDFYAAGSDGDTRELLWLIEKFKTMVLSEALGE